jgi:hypothetical protein
VLLLTDSYLLGFSLAAITPAVMGIVLLLADRRAAAQPAE